jgi:hypothetical protein
MDLKSSLDWLETYVAVARDIPPSNLLLFCSFAAVLLAIVFTLWKGAARRARALTQENAGLQVDLVMTWTSMEYERKRRLASLSWGTEIAGSSGGLDPKPPRELQDLLAKENFRSTTGTVAR